MRDKLSVMWRIWRANSYVLVAMRTEGSTIKTARRVKVEHTDRIIDHTLDELRETIQTLKEKR